MHLYRFANRWLGNCRKLHVGLDYLFMLLNPASINSWFFFLCIAARPVPFYDCDHVGQTKIRLVLAIQVANSLDALWYMLHAYQVLVAFQRLHSQLCIISCSRLTVFILLFLLVSCDSLSGASEKFLLLYYPSIKSFESRNFSAS